MFTTGVTLRKGTSSTLYEIWKGRKPTMKYFHVFGSKCYILTDREQRRKMDSKSDEGIFLGYSTNSRAYRVFNSRTKVMMESINVIADDHHEETNVPYDVETLFETSPQVSDKDDVPIPTSPKSEPEEANKYPAIKIQKDHPKELIIGDPNCGVITRSR